MELTRVGFVLNGAPNRKVGPGSLANVHKLDCIVTTELVKQKDYNQYEVILISIQQKCTIFLLRNFWDYTCQQLTTGSYFCDEEVEGQSFLVFLLMVVKKMFTFLHKFFDYVQTIAYFW